MSSPILRNLGQFLCMKDNKGELFTLLNSELVRNRSTEGKSLDVISGDTALCVPSRYMTDLAPCKP